MWTIADMSNVNGNEKTVTGSEMGEKTHTPEVKFKSLYFLRKTYQDLQNYNVTELERYRSRFLSVQCHRRRPPLENTMSRN